MTKRRSSNGRMPACVSLVVAAVICLARPAAAESLADALANAYRANPQLGAERARQRGDDENIPRALSGYRPTVSAEIGFGPTFQRDQQGRLTVSSPLTYGLNFSQTIYDGQRTSASVRSAESGVLAGRETLRSVEQTVLLTAVIAYMNVLRDRAILDLQKSNVEFLGETLRIAKRRLETGDVSRTDPAQAEARLQRGKADLALAQAMLTTSRALYRAAVGHEPRQLVFPAPAGSLVPRSLASAMGTGSEQNPDIAAASHNVDGAVSDITVAVSDLLPTVTAQGGVSGATLQGGSADPQPTAATITLQATVPIYDGGLASAQVRQSKETLGQRRFDLEAARDEVRADIRTSWGALGPSRAAVAAGETAVSANEIALAGVQREATEGRRTTLDVLNAQQELINARTNLIAARRDEVVASYAVLAATGSLDHRKLRLAGPRYNSKTHLDQVRDLWSGTRTPDGR